MLDSGTTSESSTWFGGSVGRRLLVTLICASVAAGTVVAVHRADPAPVRAASGGLDRRDGQQSGARVPPLNPTATRTNPVPADPAAALAHLLTTRSAAIISGDRAGWLAGVVAGSTAREKAFRTVQAQLFDRVRTVRPVAWRYQVTQGRSLPAARRAALGPTAWVAEVQLTYQLIRGGPQVQRQQFLTVVRRGSDWLIAADTDGTTGRDVWDLGAISQAGSSRCLVIGARTRRTEIEQLATECHRAAATVDAAWGKSWPRRTVLTVPADLADLAVLLGRTTGTASPDATSGTEGAASGASPGTTGASTDTTDTDATAGLAQTAAVTIGPADGAADGVLINGGAFDSLSAVGRRVVLTHELVHVATRATGSRSAPTWLVEGYADHVAYAGTGLSAEQVAGDALAEVRAGRVPADLPAVDDFNAAGDGAAAAYGQSWVAVELIAGKAQDAARLKAFYQQAAVKGAGAAGLDAALSTVGLGGTTDFVHLWQARLRRLAQ